MLARGAAVEFEMEISNPFAKRLTLFTPQFTRSLTPAAAAASSRQSMMVCDESVAGNLRPSASVFSGTPRAVNHATVSLAENW